MSKFKIILPLLVVVILSACGDKYEGDYSYKVGDFTFTNQDGEQVSKSDLEGKFWVVDFIFTNCTTVCPPMTSNMADLQKQLKEAGLEEEVQLVSFSVNPKKDTPKILKDYAKARGGTFDNWHLLTGYEFETIKELSIKSFKAAVEKIADSNQVMHSTRFFIVTPEGNAIKGYDGRDQANMEKIVQDIEDMS
ncbi:protein SCO1/2 [Virgibacillus subterraneus]|uniref:Protein SCO1/2 n=1 Tax=Virgibacillus subterraneus TaxID=621109 RepID=A0A1H9HMA9_9BACI|nr:SCO family protein [Virgibacillus subterraneus]SEQ63481.1 protein SCO1/2 [Virgibacillus subterraneus]